MEARQPSLLRTAYLLTGDRHTAEDLVQTALAKLYLSWDKVQQRDSVDALRPPDPGQRAQLAVAARLEEARARHRRDPREPTTPTRYDEGQRGALWEIVQTLPSKARAVVVLRYYEQLSEAETADALGISVGTVKSQASRALATLRERAPEHLHPRSQRGGAMNTNHDELERLLGDELHDRAGDIGGARLRFDDVRGRATLDPAHAGESRRAVVRRRRGRRRRRPRRR